MAWADAKAVHAATPFTEAIKDNTDLQKNPLTRCILCYPPPLLNKKTEGMGHKQWNQIIYKATMGQLSHDIYHESGKGAKKEEKARVCIKSE